MEIPDPIDAMVDTPVVAGDDLPSAKGLADLLSVGRDLEFVISASDRLLTEDSTEDETASILRRSLWSAALVAYARCFTAGKRLGLAPSIFTDLGLPKEAIDFHVFLRHMRDKHVAHSVNPFEQVRVGVVLAAPELGERRVEGVALLSMNHVATSREGVEGLRNLAQVALRWTKARAADVQELVLREAREVSVEALYGRPRLKLQAPSPDSAGQSRS